MGWLSDLTGGATDFVSDAFAGVDDAVNQSIPGGWLTVGAMAAGGVGVGALGGAAATDAAMAESLNAAGYWAGPQAASTSGAGSWLTGAGGQALTGQLISGGMQAVLGSGGGGSKAMTAADPFAGQRPQYQQALASLMSGQFTPQDPSYEWRFRQGQQATDRAQAAMGNLMSGNRLTALTDYGQGMASTEYQNQFARLAQLAGANSGSPAAAGQLLYGQQQQQQNALGTLTSALGKAAAPAASSWLSTLF